MHGIQSKYHRDCFESKHCHRFVGLSMKLLNQYMGYVELVQELLRDIILELVHKCQVGYLIYLLYRNFVIVLSDILSYYE